MRVEVNLSTKLLLKYAMARAELFHLERHLYPDVVLWGASYSDWPEWWAARRKALRRKNRLLRWEAKNINLGAGI